MDGSSVAWRVLHTAALVYVLVPPGFGCLRMVMSTRFAGEPEGKVVRRSQVVVRMGRLHAWRRSWW